MNAPGQNALYAVNSPLLSIYPAIYATRDSGTTPSTTATAPTLPASADPFSSEITEITSDGSTRCQLASVCLELAPTVTEKTWSVGSFDCRRDRNMSAVC
jgi:hypothetical protein